MRSPHFFLMLGIVKKPRDVDQTLPEVRARKRGRNKPSERPLTGKNAPEVKLSRLFQNQPFTDDRKAAFLEQIAEHGVITEACLAVGIHPCTNELHIKNDRAYRDAFNDAMGIFRHSLIMTMRHRAQKGVIKPVYQKGKRVDKESGRVIEYSDSMLMRLVERYFPEYRHKSEIVNSNVNTELPMDLASLTDEQRQALRSFLESLEQK